MQQMDREHLDHLQWKSERVKTYEGQIQTISVSGPGGIKPDGSFKHYHDLMMTH